jgi:DNA repair exonuclease SbcCD nuclease subunit
MLFVLLSDVHASSKNPVARTDSLLLAFIKKFRFILDYATKRNAVILQAGDLFNTPRDWHILFTMFDLLDEYPNIKLYTIMGQHDSYMRAKITESPTTIGALAKTEYVQVLGNRPVRLKKEGIYIYGAGWGQRVPKPKGEQNILVIHRNISMPMKANFEYTEATDFIKKHSDYDLILAGDVHHQFVHTTDNTTIVNTGPILRRDGDDYNFSHRPSFFVWNSKYYSLEKIQIPHEPSQRVMRKVLLTPEGKDEDEAFSELAEQIQRTWGEVRPHARTKVVIKEIMKQRQTSRKARKVISEALAHDG